ncbi:MAG: aminotransferase class V-fold PLP-dependent enzyme [Bacteroidota bacterium]
MLTCQKDLFRIPPEVSYLNTAYMSPLLREVEAIGKDMVSRKALPYEISPTDFFEPVAQVKKEFAKLIDTNEWDRIALIPSASYGIASVVNNIHARPNQEILMVEDQFPSNVYSWMRLATEQSLTIRTISSPPFSSQKGKVWNERILESIGPQTAVVSLPHVHWSEGSLFDLKAIREKTHELGALLIIDGTQSIGAYPFSIQEIQADAVICGGYKWLLGPYSLGVGYYGPAFDGGVPIEDNWINRLGSEDFAGLVNYEDQYKPKAHRYSMGEGSNFILLPMLYAAIRQLNRWTVANIQTYCSNISESSIDVLRSRGYDILDLDQRAAHLFGIRLVNGADTQALKARLAEQNIYVSIRGEFVRVSAHVFNTKEDFERLAANLT